MNKDKQSTTSSDPEDPHDFIAEIVDYLDGEGVSFRDVNVRMLKGLNQPKTESTMAVITTDRAREQRVRDIENALASGRIEGLEPSSEALAIFHRYIDGELTLEQMGAAIDEHADREYGPVRSPRNERS
jgi:hypothetical protein